MNMKVNNKTFFVSTGKCHPRHYPAHPLKFQKGRTGVQCLAIFFNFCKNPYFRGKNKFLPLFCPVKSSSKRHWLLLILSTAFLFRWFCFFFVYISFNEKVLINAYIWQRIFMGSLTGKIKSKQIYARILNKTDGVTWVHKTP